MPSDMEQIGSIGPLYYSRYRARMKKHTSKARRRLAKRELRSEKAELMKSVERKMYRGYYL